MKLTVSKSKNSASFYVQKTIRKSDFKARPVYLQTGDHIRAHFITCFIALVIYRILEKKRKETYTCEEIITTLKDMLISRPGDKLGYIPVYTRTDLTDVLHMQEN